MISKKEYKTRQRDILLSFFREHANKCYTARDIINDNNIAVGEATVYRYLAKLSGENKLKKFTMDNATGTYYQYNNTAVCNDHYHLKCLKCGGIIHLDCSFMINMEQHIEEKHSFLVDNFKTVIYGVCKNCN